jgi:hypothetical protein
MRNDGNDERARPRHAPRNRRIAPARRFEDFPRGAARAPPKPEARRAALAERKATPREIGGRGGKDPARYGDWEVKGIAVDF